MHLVVQKSLSPHHAIGRTRGIQGFWTSYFIFRDGVSEPYDTIWTLALRNVKYLAVDSNFLLMKSDKGRFLLTGTPPGGKTFWHRTHSEKHYLELRAKYSIPSELALRTFDPGPDDRSAP